MRNVVSKPYALLFVIAAACLTSSCSKREPVQAGSTKIGRASCRERV